jgi:molybdenum cofactor cytidylyltransferase
MAANIRGILLAAGYSTRFGSNKLLHALPAGSPDAGTPIALAAARHFIEALPESVAVIRPRAQKLGKLLRDAGCNTVVCKNAAEGMGVSPPEGRAADGLTPIGRARRYAHLRPDTVRIIAKALSEGAAIAPPSYRGERGHPVGFARRFLGDLSALRGDAGARDILKKHPDWITLYEVDDPGVLRDIDEPSDLER